MVQRFLSKGLLRDDGMGIREATQDADSHKHHQQQEATHTHCHKEDTVLHESIESQSCKRGTSGQELYNNAGAPLSKWLSRGRERRINSQALSYYFL